MNWDTAFTDSTASTENIKEILRWWYTADFTSCTPTPQELEEKVYEDFLQSKTFNKRVKKVEKILKTNPDKLPAWNR